MAYDMDQLKKSAAYHAVATYLRSGLTIGLGTGSTVDYALRAIADSVSEGTLVHCVFVSSSQQTTARAHQLGIPITNAENILGSGPLDVYIDGADAVNAHKELIKGRGGALTREKVLAYNSDQVIIMVDDSKMVDVFHPTGCLLPIEALPYTARMISRHLTELRLHGSHLFDAISIRGASTGDRWVTDSGNYILDARFASPLSDGRAVEELLDSIAGVICNGLFCRCEATVVCAHPAGIRVI